MEPNRQGEVWVFAEHDEGSLIDVTLELCGKARELADQLGVRVGAVLPVVRRGSGRPLDRLWRRRRLRGRRRAPARITSTAPYAQVLISLDRQAQAADRDLRGDAAGPGPGAARRLRVAGRDDRRLHRPGDRDVTDPKTKDSPRKTALQIRPAFGGNIIATIVNYDRWPQMATVREGVMPIFEPDDSRRARSSHEDVEIDKVTHAVKLIERHVRAASVNLKGARVIVAGGGGVGSKDKFQLIHELAGVLGGAVGASRAAVDGGYIDKEHQVGQTGTTVRPALYIACGISGAVQHRAGMEESAKIIAINTDPTRRSSPSPTTASWAT